GARARTGPSDPRSLPGELLSDPLARGMAAHLVRHGVGHEVEGGADPRQRQPGALVPGEPVQRELESALPQLGGPGHAAGLPVHDDHALAAVGSLGSAKTASITPRTAISPTRVWTGCSTAIGDLSAHSEAVKASRRARSSSAASAPSA